ncbi:KH domain-containing protein [Methanobrevibacter sp.]|uniref:KH domain-containing protein n=1 Tax=Methanobrevibacter sp. TaxID=66852 RepID=UPI00262DD3EB|nr:KH domain-containing protein [uncultured Methanobrevibacter sp.]
MPTTESLKIPLDRLGPLIGLNGAVKKEIESLTGTSLYINSNDGTVVISPTEDMEDPFAVSKTYEIVKSIGKGFHPEKAIQLNDDDYYLEIIELEAYSGESKEELDKQTKRVIGRNGMVINTISELAEISIKIYGNEISLIGNFDNVMLGKKAFVMILNGSKHKSVYEFLKTS